VGVHVAGPWRVKDGLIGADEILGAVDEGSVAWPAIVVTG